MATREVYFNIYCNACKHQKLDGAEEPCNDCLSHPSNEDSHKPWRFEDAEND